MVKPLPDVKANDVTPAKLREFASIAGIKVGVRGRIGREVRDNFDAQPKKVRAVYA